VACFHLNENQQNEQNQSRISNEPTIQKRTIPNACPTKISKITIFSPSALDATTILDPFSLIDFLSVLASQNLQRAEAGLFKGKRRAKWLRQL